MNRLPQVGEGQSTDDAFVLLNLLTQSLRQFELGAVVGRILKVQAAPVGSPWMWTLAFGQHEDRTPTHGYAAS
jgi:hypothetical protein